MDRADIKKLWAEHGGETHGPRVETVTMPEHLFWGFVDALITAARRPDGWVMVPREPTEAMIKAAWADLGDTYQRSTRNLADAYRAMLSAAPANPTHWMPLPAAPGEPDHG